MRVVFRNGIPPCSGSRKISGSSVPPKLTPSMPFCRAMRSTIASKPSRVSGKKNPVHQFAQIFLVDVILVRRFGDNNGDFFLGENIRIHRRRHREPRAEKRHSLHPPRFCCRARHSNDADQRNRRTLSVAHRTQGGAYSPLSSPKCGPGPMEPVQLGDQIIHDRDPIISLKSVPQSLHVDAVNHQRRIAPIRFPLSIQTDNRLVVIDRRFRPDPANDPQQSHDCPVSVCPANRISLVATNPIFS